MNGVLRMADVAFGWVLQTSWQAAVLVIVIVLAQALFRRQLSPAWRYALWLLLLVRLLLPTSPQTSWSIYNFARLPGALDRDAATPGSELADRQSLLPRSVTRLVASLQSEPNPPKASSENRAKAGLPPSTLPQTPSGQPGRSFSWHWLAFFIWILVACAFALRLAWSNVRFSQEIHRGSMTKDDSILLLLKTCREALHVCQPVTLIETNAVKSPSIQGVWRKRLLLPHGTLASFSREELRCVFLHELAHIKRRDLEVNWLTSLLLIVHWFNPLLWMAFARMQNDRELACDALVLTNLGSTLAESYGETIIKVVESWLPQSRHVGVLALSEDRQRLEERIRMIARFRRWPRWSALTLILSLGIAVVGLTNASRARVTTASAQDKPTQELPQDHNAPFLPRGIHGRVLDAEGNPVTNAFVECQGFGWQTSTDEQGRFSWIGEEHPRTFQIRKRGYKTLLTELLMPGESETTLRLQHAPEIAGRVFDRQTRQPIATFKVYHVRILQGPVTPSLNPHEVVTGSSGAFKYSFAQFFWPDSEFYIDAEGYMPLLSRPLTRADDGKELMFELTRSQPVEGKVLTPQGAPAEKAEIRLWCGEINIPDIPRPHLTKSDRNGVFTLPTILDGKVLVFHNSGYAEVPWKDFTVKSTVQLSEWGHVKGHWPKPLPKNRRASLERMNWSGRMNTYTFPPPWTISSTEVKPDGGFEFEEGAPPGEYMLTEWNDFAVNWPGGGYSMGLLISKRVPIRVEPGRTTFVEVPTGSSVTGKISVEDEQSFTNVHLPIVSLQLKQKESDPKFPPMDPSLSDAQNFDRWKQYRHRVLEYWLSDQGMAQRRAERVYEIFADPSGTFRIDNVSPGTYELKINAERWSDKSGPEIQREISVSALSDGNPIDLGILK